MSYQGIGTIIDLPGSPAFKAYWAQRAQQCKMFADEGACLARVARNVPVTISGFGQTPTTTSSTLELAAVGAAGLALGWFLRGRRVKANRRRSTRR